MKPQKPHCSFIFFVSLVLTLYPATPDHDGPTSRSSTVFTTLDGSRYGHSPFHVDHVFVAAAETASTVVDARSVDDPPSQFTWRIEKFSKLNTKKLYTESFYAGGYKWRVLVFPKGNNVNDFSIYLDAADSATLPFGWSRYIKFSLSVINHIDKKFTVKKDSQHLFNAQESDWGWTSFVPLSELYDPGRGYLVNDTCVVEVNFPGLCSVELKVEAVKTTSGKGEILKSSSEGDIDGRTRQSASGTEKVLPQTFTSGPPPACKSATEVIKTSVPPTTPIVETEVTINSPRAQDLRAIHKDFIAKEAKLQQEFELLQAGLGKISEKKSAEKEIKQLHENMVNLEQSRSSVLEEISTLEIEKKTAESSLSSIQQKWTELRHTFMEPNN